MSVVSKLVSSFQESSFSKADCKAGISRGKGMLVNRDTTSKLHIVVFSKMLMLFSLSTASLVFLIVCWLLRVMDLKIPAKYLSNFCVAEPIVETILVLFSDFSFILFSDFIFWQES